MSADAPRSEPLLASFSLSLPCPCHAVADFKSHITGSTLVGVGYGYWGVTAQSMSLENGILAGGLCAVSGMLPDLDSDSGIPLRETSMFVAAIAPMLMIDRFRDLGLSHEAMALAAMLVYIGDSFRCGRVLQEIHGSPRHVAQYPSGVLGGPVGLSRHALPK